MKRKITSFDAEANLIKSKLAKIKCIVLDCDNVLWDGVAAEGSISITPEHVELYKLLLLAKNKGYMLALNSKNSLDNIKRVLRENKQILFSLDDFVSVQVNWESKADNMATILKDTNIKPDALLFFDDDLRQQVEVAAAFNDILLPSIGRYDIQNILKITKMLVNKLSALTKEDSLRTIMIQQNHKRKELSAQFSCREEFLVWLEPKIGIKSVSAEMDRAQYAEQVDNDRVAQLFERTNQFNLSGNKKMPYPTLLDWEVAHDLPPFLAESEVDGDREKFSFVFDYEDKLGSLGTVGACVYEYHKPNGRVVLDEFMLSCRAFGLQVEQMIINHIINKHGARKIDADLTNAGAKVKEFLQSIPTSWGIEWKHDENGRTPNIELRDVRCFELVAKDTYEPPPKKIIKLPTSSEVIYDRQNNLKSLYPDYEPESENDKLFLNSVKKSCTGKQVLIPSFLAETHYTCADEIDDNAFSLSERFADVTFFNEDVGGGGEWGEGAVYTDIRYKVKEGLSLKLNPVMVDNVAKYLVKNKELINKCDVDLLPSVVILFYLLPVSAGQLEIIINGGTLDNFIQRVGESHGYEGHYQLLYLPVSLKTSAFSKLFD